MLRATEKLLVLQPPPPLQPPPRVSLSATTPPLRPNLATKPLRPIKLFESAPRFKKPYLLIIPATDIGNGCVHVFKSQYDGDFTRDKNVRVADAVLASCSAPTYFNPHIVNKYLLADGGLWANCPSLVAAVDAKKRFEKSFTDLKILSVGTGAGRLYYPQKTCLCKRFFGWGFATRWKRGHFIEMLLNLQSQAANNMLGLMLEPNQILRLNFESDAELPLDDPREQADLISRADRDFTYNSKLIKYFLELEKQC